MKRSLARLYDQKNAADFALAARDCHSPRSGSASACPSALVSCWGPIADAFAACQDRMTDSASLGDMSAGAAGGGLLWETRTGAETTRAL